MMMMRDRDSSLGSIASTCGGLGLALSPEEADAAASREMRLGLPESLSMPALTAQHHHLETSPGAVVSRSASAVGSFTHNPYSFGVEFKWDVMPTTTIESYQPNEDENNVPRNVPHQVGGSYYGEMVFDAPMLNQHDALADPVFSPIPTPRISSDVVGVAPPPHSSALAAGRRTSAPASLPVPVALPNPLSCDSAATAYRTSLPSYPQNRNAAGTFSPVPGNWDDSEPSGRYLAHHGNIRVTANTPSPVSPVEKTSSPSVGEDAMLDLVILQLNLLKPADSWSSATVASIFDSLPQCKPELVYSKLPQFFFAKAISDVGQLHFWAEVCSQFYQSVPTRKRIYIRIELLRLLTRAHGMTLSQASLPNDANEGKVRHLRLASTTFCGLLYNYGVLQQQEVHDKVLDPMTKRAKLAFLPREACFSLQCSLLLLRIIYKVADGSSSGRQSYVDKILFELMALASPLDEQIHTDVVQFLVRREEERLGTAAVQPHP